MGMHTSPPFQRREIGKQLRQLRERAALKASEVAVRVEISTGRLSRIENGEVAPDIPLAKCLLDLYMIPVSDWEPYLEQVRNARKGKGWWQAFGLAARGYLALETAASSVDTFQLAYLPGLLQTEDHARALFQSCSLDMSERRIELDVEVRMIRQERLVSEDDPLRLTAIVDHTALERRVGTREVARAQLRHLMEVSELPSVDLRVIPPSAGPHTGMDGSFSLLRFSGTTQPDLAYFETVASSFQIEKAEEVRTCRIVFDRLSAIALDPDSSVAYIRRVERDL